MYFWAVVLKCFKIEKMRETVITLKIQFVLKYRMVHSSYSVAVWFSVGFLLYQKAWNRAHLLQGKNTNLYSFILATFTVVTIMKIFLTFLTYLVLCFQMPFNQVTGYFSTAESRSIFHRVAFHVCNFFSLKGNFNFLHWSHRVPLIMAIHSSGKIINVLTAVVLQSATQVLFWLNLFT